MNEIVVALIVLPTVRFESCDMCFYFFGIITRHTIIRYRIRDKTRGSRFKEFRETRGGHKMSVFSLRVTFAAERTSYGCDGV